MHQEGRAATEGREPESGVFGTGSGNATPPSSRAIARAAARIAQLRRAHGIARACATGEIIVQEVYRGDIGAFRTRGAKDDSLRKLASHPDLELSPATLWRAVGVYLLCARMPGFRNPKHLRVGHLYAVLGLPEQRQEELLRCAEVERWSIERLKAKVADYRPERPRRKPRRTLLRHVGPLRRLLSLPLPNLEVPLPEDACEEIEDLLVQLDQWTTELRKRLRRAH